MEKYFVKSNNDFDFTKFFYLFMILVGRPRLVIFHVFLDHLGTFLRFDLKSKNCKIFAKIDFT